MKASAMSDGLSEPRQAGEKDQAETPAQTNSAQPADAKSPALGAPSDDPRRPPGEDAASAGPSVPSGSAPVVSAAGEATPTGTPGAPAAAAPATGRGLLSALRRFFWMDERLASARKQGYSTGQPGWEEFDLGRAALADAAQLGESGEGQGSALLLYRGATLLLTRAQVARAGVGLEPTASNEVCWSRLDDLPVGKAQLAEMTEEQRTLVTGSLSGQGEAYLAQLTKEKRLQAARAMSKLAQGLGDPLEADAKRVGRVLITRWARIGVATLLVGIASWVMVDKITDKPNLALHRPVTVVTPHPVHARDPSGVVDGDLTNLGFHTIEAPNQSITIDLGAVHSISKVILYNRPDCCQERAYPVKVEVSVDGQQFQLVAERNEPYERWKAKFPSVQARYVKLTDLKNTAFHLSEVEVY
jgi:hypothetical protein